MFDRPGQAEQRRCYFGFHNLNQLKTRAVLLLR